MTPLPEALRRRAAPTTARPRARLHAEPDDRGLDAPHVGGQPARSARVQAGLRGAGHAQRRPGSRTSSGEQATRADRHGTSARSHRAAVLALVVRAELARLERPPPRLVRAVPAPPSSSSAAANGWRGRPAERLHLARSRARSDGRGPGRSATRLDQRLRLAGQSQDLAREHEVLAPRGRRRCCRPRRRALAQHEVDRRAVVEHVEPVAHVAGRRRRAAAARSSMRVGHEERDDLLRVLVGPEVVRRARDDDGHAVRVPVGASASRSPPAFAAEYGFDGLQRRRPRAPSPRAMLPYTSSVLTCSKRGDPQLAHGLQQREDAEHVGAEERRRAPGSSGRRGSRRAKLHDRVHPARARRARASASQMSPCTNV